ncbi:hypothetical protein OQA88_1798 [Cercophora sp. LCS_1]
MPTEIIREPSTELQVLLHGRSVSTAIVDLLRGSQVIYSAGGGASMVFKVSETLVAKRTNGRYATTEHGSLRYLHKHLPGFPVPRSHGIVRIGNYYFLFTDFIHGTTLQSVWTELDDNQKCNISNKLNVFFTKLRELPHSPLLPFGGVDGEGCYDIRQGLRINLDPIWDVKQFEEWLFSGSRTASPMYSRLLRSMMQTTSSKCVFTHGDARTANIIVDGNGEEGWKVVAIIDWAASGFYPEYWESVKATNNLTPRDNLDWYEHLPASISPHRSPVKWLADRLWDRSMQNY